VQQARRLPYWPMADRVVITVHDSAARPVANARVEVQDEGQQLLFSGRSAMDGRVLFFPRRDGGADSRSFAVTVTPPGEGAVTVRRAGLSAGEDWDVQLPHEQPLPPEALDLVLLLDTTGSMGDEIAYLKAELRAVVEGIRAFHPGLSLRLSLIAYRDHGDSYVTLPFRFTDDLDLFSCQLLNRQARGGGDFEEAVPEAFARLLELDWRTEAVRLVFWVADAPPHPGDDARRLLSQADRLRAEGVKVFPVASSGVDRGTEYLMRLTAAMTLARYLFLTDDSGIGGSHLEPTIPCYQVQLLAPLLSRLILGELSGTRLEPAPGEVVRTVGQPSQGRCELGDGQVVYF